MNLWLLGGQMEGKGWSGSLGSQGHAAIFKADDQRGPTVEHRELCSVLCAAWMGGEFREKGYMCMHG